MNIKKTWLLICLYSQITNIPQEELGFACELSPRLHQKSLVFLKLTYRRIACCMPYIDTKCNVREEQLAI